MIQNAIDKVGNMPFGAGGFRGAVLLRAGKFKVSGSIFMRKSGVVLRGVGSGSGDGNTIIYSTKASKYTFLQVYGSGSGSTSSPTVSLTGMYHPVGARSVTVSSVDGFKVGDLIVGLIVTAFSLIIVSHGLQKGLPNFCKKTIKCLIPGFETSSIVKMDP